MVPDSTLDRAFFLREVSADTYSLDIYDLQRLTHLNSISIPGVLGYPTQMVRWGSQGLAFLTDAGSGVGMLYILQGTDISGLPAPPAGCITLNPATVFVGVPSPATITVTGSNFLTSSTVLVNDSPRTTSYISPTQLSFQLTSADLASAPGTHTLSETNDNVETCS